MSARRLTGRDPEPPPGSLVETPGGTGYLRGGDELQPRPWVNERTGGQASWAEVTVGGPVTLLASEGGDW